MFSQTKPPSFSIGFDLQKIIKNIYVGDEDASKNKELLSDLGIKHIVTAGKQLKQCYPKQFNYLYIPVRDHRQQNITQYFNSTFQFIKNAVQKNQGVLIHCRMGKSRSVTLVTAYMMKKYNMGFRQALNFLKRKRDNASPNQGFLRQLQKYEALLKQNKSD